MVQINIVVRSTFLLFFLPYFLGGGFDLTLILDVTCNREESDSNVCNVDVEEHRLASTSGEVVI